MKSLLTNLIPRIPFRKQGGDSSRQVLTAAAQREFTPIVVEHNGEANLPAGITKHDHEIVAVADLPAFSRTLTRGIGQDTLQQLCPIQLDDPEGRRVFALVLVERMLTSDVTEEVIASFSREFAPATPCIYVATHNVLSELASASIDADGSKRLGVVPKSAHWARFEEIVKFALEHGASDLHFKPRTDVDQSTLGFRIDGIVVKPRRFIIKSDIMRDMLAYLYGARGISNTTNQWSVNEPLQCQLEETIGGHPLTFRWGQLDVKGGAKVVMRVSRLDDSGSFKTLGCEPGGAGYPAHQVEIWERNVLSAGGGILISGVVNSGKSKTLHAVLSMIPDGYEINTAEDPIEDILGPNGNQHATSRSFSDTSNVDPFMAFKLQNKRMDPDVTMISELRDQLTASTFRDSVLSGQRVFATIHADNALAIFERLASEEFGLTRDMIALPNFLKLLVYQALVPKTCPHCKLDPTDGKTSRFLNDLAAKEGEASMRRLIQQAARAASVETLQRVDRVFGIDPSRIRIRNPAGCSHCRREGVPELNGIRGRMLVAQMVEPTLDMLTLVRDANNIELHRLYRSMRTAPFDSDNSDGKTPLEVSMYRVATGDLCLTEVERRFQSIASYERTERPGTGAHITVPARPSQASSTGSAKRRTTKPPTKQKGKADQQEEVEA